MMKKRISALLLLLSLLVFGMGEAQAAVKSYDPSVNYMQKILDVLHAGGPQAMETGTALEILRNMKIDGEGMSEEKTDYFEKLPSPEEILKAIQADKNKGKTAGYTEEDLYWLARVINAEVGGSWMPDWLQQAVGSVVLNRVRDAWYPDTIKEVVFQPGQYACTTNGSIYNEPAPKAVNNARYLLENGATLPAGVLGQSEFIQGEIHSTYDDPYLATTTYFCYL